LSDDKIRRGDMPTYRGNRGNLLQHWVLIELLGCLREQGIRMVSFVDTYSMSPMPVRSKKAATDQTAAEFDLVRSRLAVGTSGYERAWLALSQALPSEYPSSAAFVGYCWGDSAHLLLCEADRQTADDIQRWLSRRDGDAASCELHRGDWRERLRRPILADADAYYLSCDPNMYDRHAVRSQRPENMYPRDIAIVADAIRRLPAVPVVVQLSTYSVNGANSQSDVYDDLVPRFTELNLSPTLVRADNSMMSFIFSRGLAVPSDLEIQFRSWLAERSRC
jgi:hypothetical protein